jgi:predicted nucleic acid-binding Zn ribbon protein
MGWSWYDAHGEARELVKAALDMNGARRPAWYEAQPEYPFTGYEFTHRTRCIRCGNRLPETARFWCSEECKKWGVEARKERDEYERVSVQRRVHVNAWESVHRESRRAA